MPLPLGAATPPSWVLPGAYADCDFANNRYWARGCVVDQNTSFNKLSLSTNSGAYGNVSAIDPYTPTKSGVLFLGKQGAHRITDLGLFAERVSTNYCLQSRDLSNASWNTKTTATVAKDQIGNDNASVKAGTSSCSSILATGANAIVTQDITTAAQRPYTVAIAVAGTGYATNEVITTTGGTFDFATKVKVLTQTAGVPATIQYGNSAPVNYTVLPSNPVLQGSTTGTGAGLTVNLTFESFVFSAYVKRLVGTGTIWMTSGNGVWTDITSQITTTGFTWITNLPQINGLNTYTVGFKLGTSGDKIAVDFCQFEPATAANNALPFMPSPTGGMPTTPMLTTTVATGRGNEIGYWQVAAVVGTSANAGQNIFMNVLSSNAPYSFISAFNGDCYGGGPNVIASDCTNPTSVQGGGGAQFGPGAAQTANSGNNGRVTAGNAWNVAAIRCNKQGTYCCLNGGAVAGPNTTSPSWLPNANVGSTHFGMGNSGSGISNSQLDGSIGRVTFFTRELTDAEMVNYTSPATGYGQY